MAEEAEKVSGGRSSKRLPIMSREGQAKLADKYAGKFAEAWGDAPPEQKAAPAPPDRGPAEGGGSPRPLAPVESRQAPPPPAPTPDRDPGTGRFLPQGEPPPAQAAPAKAPAAAPPLPQNLLKLNYKGTIVEAPVEKVVELAQQGLDYSQKMKALNGESQEYREFQNYRAHLQKHAPLAEAIGNLMTTYEETGRLPRLVIEGGELPAGAVEIPKGFAERESKINRMIDDHARETQAKDVERRLSEMKAIIARDPFLHQLSVSSFQRHGKDLALQKLVDAHLADPDADLEILARHVATEQVQLLETLGVDPRYVQRKEEDQKRFSSEPPGGQMVSAPAPEGRPKRTGKDLMRGLVGKDAVAFIRRRAMEALHP